MKKSKLKLTFASAVTAAGAVIGMSGCGVHSEPAPDVYGPPEYFEEDDTGNASQTDEDLPLVPDAENDDEPANEVYGPPEDFDENDIVDPVETVYGPPEYFEYNGDDVEAPLEDVYGPPEFFDKDGEEPDRDDLEQPIPPVYGPPGD